MTSTTMGRTRAPIILHSSATIMNRRTHSCVAALEYPTPPIQLRSPPAPPALAGRATTTPPTPTGIAGTSLATRLVGSMRVFVGQDRLTTSPLISPTGEFLTTLGLLSGSISEMLR